MTESKPPNNLIRIGVDHLRPASPPSNEGSLPQDDQELRGALAGRLPDMILRAIHSHLDREGPVRLLCCEPGRTVPWYTCMVEFLPSERVVLFDDRGESVVTSWGRRIGDRVYENFYRSTDKAFIPKWDGDPDYALAALSRVEIERDASKLGRIEATFETPPGEAKPGAALCLVPRAKPSAAP